MYYTVYKITNKLNSKFYIGKHQTKNLDDGYMGSGKLLKRAIEKHGIQNFTKEILFIFDNEQEMNDKEKELVVVSEETYNLCEGGKGGFSYINSLDLDRTYRGKKGGSAGWTVERRQKTALLNKTKFYEYNKSNPVRNSKGMTGKSHSFDTKCLMSKSQEGLKNSQFGSFWITNGIINKKCKTEMPEGFRKGRIKI